MIVSIKMGVIAGLLIGLHTVLIIAFTLGWV